ncbi:MAG: DUF4912 domain-containing protein [Treponema sp.]|jgi:hypothetical protein|nr:DUF4912 domain-containing protein [Treponema sp.]
MKESQKNAKSAQIPVSRTRLATMSTGELMELADNFGIYIPYGLERIFIIEELLEYSNSNTGEVKNEIEVSSSCLETAALPKQYNISFVEVLIRDPLWVYVYWEIKGQDRELHENALDFKGYCLSLVTLENGDAEIKTGKNSFTMPVSADESARYLGITEQSLQAQFRYKIMLGVIRGEAELPIAESLPFCLPRLIENESINSMKANPLLRLSGIQDLLTIKNTEQQSKGMRR